MVAFLCGASRVADGCTCAWGLVRRRRRPPSHPAPDSTRRSRRPGKEGGGGSKPTKALVNPFLPYEEALWVGHLSPTHTLLLNKFNVVEKVGLRALSAQSLRAVLMSGQALGAGSHGGPLP